MILTLTAVCVTSFVCFIRVFWRGEVFKAGLFLALAMICGVWASHLHVPGMRDWLPGPLIALGILTFCMSCGRHETFVWNWLISPFGQVFGGSMAIAGFALSTMCITW